MQHEFQLYHYWRSSCSWRLRWALDYKSLSYEKIHINLLKDEQNAAAFKAKNPAGKLPCLLIDQKPFGESLALIECLEELYPAKPALLPKDPFDRLFARQLAYLVMSQIQPVQNISVLKKYSEEPSKQKEWAAFWITSGLSAYEALLKQKTSHDDYSVGSSLSLADLCLIPQCYNARRFDVKMEEFPLILAIEANCQKLESYYSSHPDRFQPD